MMHGIPWIEGRVPELETDRLRMRGHRVADLASCAALWSDPIVTRFIGGRPSTVEEAWARLLRYVGHWALLGHGFWVVEDKATGEYVGEVGIGEFMREIEPRIEGRPEVGWVVASRHHGKGYATEAVRAALTWGETRFGKRRFACIIAPENAASLNVAAKTGFREAARTTYKGEPTVVLYREP